MLQCILGRFDISQNEFEMKRAKNRIDEANLGRLFLSMILS